MADKVVDASALPAIASAEPAADAVLDQTDRRRLHAPALVVVALIDVAWKRARRQPAVAALFLEALDAIEGVGLRFRGINQGEVGRLGVRTGLTAYDASYL